MHREIKDILNKIHKEINNYLCKYKGIKEMFYPRIFEVSLFPTWKNTQYWCNNGREFKLRFLEPMDISEVFIQSQQVRDIEVHLYFILSFGYNELVC